MKFLFLVFAYPPYVSGGAINIKDITKELCSLGHEVKIITVNGDTHNDQSDLQCQVELLRYDYPILEDLFRLFFGKAFNILHSDKIRWKQETDAKMSVCRRKQTVACLKCRMAHLQRNFIACI